MSRPGVDSGQHRFVSMCKTCKEEVVFYRKSAHPTNPRMYHEECRPAGGRSSKLTMEQRKRNARSAALKTRYGVDADEWDEVLRKQGGVCAGCGKPPPKSGRSLHTDHDHKTGVFRGILCWQCNSSVLRRGVTARVLRNLADYLDNPPAVSVLGERKPEKKFGRSQGGK
jgi:hypothetical protein